MGIRRHSQTGGKDLARDAALLRPLLASNQGGSFDQIVFNNPTVTQGLGLWIKHTTQPYQVDVDDGETLSLVHFDLEATGDGTAGILYGLHIETAAATVDKSAAIALINKGHADSLYIKVAGEAGNPASNSPTGIGIDLNQLNDGSTDEGSSSNGGHQGLQIYDWSTTDQGVGGPRAVFLNKIGNMDTDHQLLNLRGNRRSIELITNSASGSYDDTQPIIRLADEDTSNDLAVLTAAGNLTLGTPDTGAANQIVVAGAGTGNTQGGGIQLQMAADYDGSFDAWIIDINTNTLRLRTDGTNRFSITQAGLSTVHGALQVNQTLDVDGDATFNANVGIGIDGASAAELVHVYDGILKVEGTGYEGQTGGTLYLQTNNPTPANDVVGGMIRGWAKNEVGDDIVIGDIYFQITDITEDLEDSAIRFVTQLDHVDQFILNLVEDQVGINKLAPTEALDVTGNVLASGNITALGDLYASGGDVVSGVSDTTRGIFHAYGPSTGQTLGGLIRLYMAADHDASNDFWQVDVNNTNFRVTLDGSTARLTLTTAGTLTVDGNFTAETGSIFAGLDDNTRGILTAYGAGASQTQGGILRLHLSADHDTTYQYWQMDVSQDTLRFLTDSTERAFISPTGNVIASNNLYAFGGLVSVSGAASGNEGGELQLNFSDDFDSTYEWYRIDAFQDELRFGREGETAVTFAGVSGEVAVFGNGTGQPAISINGASGGIRDFRFQTGGSNRWIIRVDNTAESGSDAGSDFAIHGRDDSGNDLGPWFRILRANGATLIGNPTGGYKGAGSLNASAVYDDNTLLTPYVFEAHLTGAIDMDRLDGRVPNRHIPARRDNAGREIQAARTEERIHAPARRFVANMEAELDPAQYAALWRASGRLPAFPSEAEWETEGNFSTGDLIQRLMETVEVQAVHISKLHDRLTAVEASLN